jgi:cytochrome c biogenesis protein CcmG/thiol:disulfide interchange protein DsbE
MPFSLKQRNSMKNGILSLTVVALLFPALLVGQSGTKAPNFSLKAANGKTVELKKLQGKVVVVNFWATWCGPCKAEIPGFLEVYQQYKSKGLEIVGISLDQDGWKPVKPFIERYKSTYPVVVGDGSLAEAYGGIDAIPTTFVIDKKGNIAARHVGFMDKKALEGLMKGLL